VSQPSVTKTFICRAEHLGIVRNNLDSKAERIKGPAERQIHIAEKFILRFAQRRLKCEQLNFRLA
jgi:hypothetical protein